MKRFKPTIVSVLALALMGGIASLPAAALPAPAQAFQDFPWPWAQPPQEYSEIQRHGFHDGIDAAHHDIHDGRPPNPRRHDKFRHPDVPRDQREQFRDAFRHGYEMAYQHRDQWGHDHDR